MGQWLFFCKLDAASKSLFNHQYIFVEKGKQVGFLLLGVLHCGVVVRGISSLFFKYKMLGSRVGELSWSCSREKPQTPLCV